MAQKLEIPGFANEAEEAQWWFDNEDAVAAEFALARQEGRLGRGTTMRRAQEAARAAVAVVPDAEDIERAQEFAKLRGVEYQTYLKSVIHEAMLNEQQRVDTAA